MQGETLLHMAGLTAIGLASILTLYGGISILATRRIMEVRRLPLTPWHPPENSGLSFSEVSFPSRDGLNLKGWYLSGSGASAIIIVVGGHANRLDENVDTPGLACSLAREGYNVLLFDLRGRGLSEGKGIVLSRVEEDIGGAVDFLKSRGFPPEKVCLLGFSLGALYSCIYGHRHPVGALILDGCPADIIETVKRGAISLGIPGFLAAGIIPGMAGISHLLYGYRRIEPASLISGIECPIFFIHEERDNLITWEDVQSLHRASSHPACQLWQVKNATHSQSFKTSPEEYIRRVDSFLSGTSARNRF